MLIDQCSYDWLHVFNCAFFWDDGETSRNFICTLIREAKDHRLAFSARIFDLSVRVGTTIPSSKHHKYFFGFTCFQNRLVRLHIAFLCIKFFHPLVSSSITDQFIHITVIKRKEVPDQLWWHYHSLVKCHYVDKPILVVVMNFNVRQEVHLDNLLTIDVNCCLLTFRVCLIDDCLMTLEVCAYLPFLLFNFK